MFLKPLCSPAKNVLLIFALAFCFVSPAPAQSESKPDPNPAKTRATELSGRLISSSFANGNPDPKTWDDVCSDINNYQKDYGVTEATTNNLFYLRRRQLWAAKRFPNPSLYLALLEQLKSDPNPAIASLAMEQLATVEHVADLAKKPIEMQFTALDGTAVDLAKMRGKVVAVYFWAAADPDCAVVNPEVVAVYKKYHDQGFEVVAISLDENRKVLFNFIRNNEMPWPQYFDGLKWSNAISKSYEIHSIPTLWLVDKTGTVVNRQAIGNLDVQVANLLKNP